MIVSLFYRAYSVRKARAPFSSLRIVSQGIAVAARLAPMSRVSGPYCQSLRYHNLGLHIRMQTAEIFKRSCFIEGEAELVLGVERRRTKRAIQ